MNTNTNTNLNHPLIINSQEYIVFKKYFSLHSEDIDTSKYTVNSFEIELPQNYANVLSLRLEEYRIPPNIYNFSKELGNTVLYFDISLNLVNPSGIPDTNVSLIAIIPNGQYLDPFNLLYVVCQAMNSSVNAYLGLNNYVNFDFISNTIINTSIPPTYTYPATTFTLFNTTPAALYTSLGYGGYSTSSSVGSPILNYVTAVNPINFDMYTYIYMQIEGYDNVDEIIPYIQTEYSTRNSGNAGVVNSFFAKLPLSNNDPLTIQPVVNQVPFFFKGESDNYRYFNPPAERIRKLKIKFVYHNDVLVNFNGGSYSFLLVFTLYNNQILRNMNLSRPVTLI
jgi:hypothetical protein